MLREIISLADHVICLSVEEMQRISKCLGVSNRPFSLVRNAADYAAFGSASPDWFVSTYGVKDFALCVGRIESRKNQAMLLYSLRESGVPVVFVGQNGEPDYERICRALAPKGTLFINQLNRHELASAYAAAKVCVLPSWAEGASLSNLEAAAACCPLVVSNRASEFEYFGDGVRYCDPADWRSIAAAVKESIASYDTEKKKRVELRDRLMSTCTWEAAAEATVWAYERAIDG
jgi:glycosyltransferase involved in cell wall biosynthesis